MKIQSVAIIGLGLLGGSLGLAIGKFAPHITTRGYDREVDVREKARARGLVGTICETPMEAVDQADLVIFCVPVGAMRAAAEAVSGAIKPNAIVSDVGSSKQSVVEALSAALPAHIIIAAHPVAGTEESGPEAGFADLFVGRWCILTPAQGEAGGPEHRASVSGANDGGGLGDGGPSAGSSGEAQIGADVGVDVGVDRGSDEGADGGADGGGDDANLAAIAALSALWESLGSKVEIMDAAHHDLVLAVTSHIPHLIAYTIVGTASDLEDVTRSEVIKYSAGGFRDFTRIAASDPTMWRDVFLNNQGAVLEMLGRFSEDLTALRRAIRNGDGEALHDLFTRTRAIRKSIVEQGQD